MRLLTFREDGELQVTRDFVSDVPPYAILSHTWGPDEDEVSFHDLNNGSGKSKAGYKKILFCGEQARKDGLQYFWVDTCCIDRTNGVEWSEAINLMYRWFKNAAKCYVYLSDVSFNPNDGQNDQRWKKTLRTSKWFTRSWTLQELLAPESVEFFSREGQLLGGKQTLEWEIHEITGIPVSALRGTPLSQFSTKERLKWAARRQSRWKEDQAYSLMGIFGVSMPMIYGEGDNAFKRLQREIEKRTKAEESIGKVEHTPDGSETLSAHSLDSRQSGTIDSSATLIGEILAAANEFLVLLLDDSTIESLFSTAFIRIEADKVQRNVKRILQLYASDLQREAKSDNEKEAVRLIRMRARYVSYRIRQRYDKAGLQNFDDLVLESNYESGRRGILEAYLAGKASQDHYDGQKDRENSSDEDEDSEGHVDQLELSDLDRVKAFMIESSAYRRFKQNLQDFVLPRKRHGPQDPVQDDSSVLDSYTTWYRFNVRATEIFSGLKILSRPFVPPGYKRITWMCGCGALMYADIREHKLGEASKLQELLRRSVTTTTIHGAGGGTPSSPQRPVQAHISTGSGFRTSNNEPLPSKTNNSANSATMNTTIGTAAPGLSNNALDYRYLLLCLTINGSSTLEQLSIGNLSNDQYLWEKIRDRYHELHKKNLWHQKIFLTKWLSTFHWVSKLVSSTDLMSPKSIQFVRFQLVPVAMDVRPWNFHSPSLPPEIEVKVRKTYHYNPCPFQVDPTGLNQFMLHCLWKPGPHLDHFWLDLFPKKLKDAMCYESSKPDSNTGWGIRIVEGINWSSITLLGFTLVVCSATLGITYSIITHDVGAAFSMSAFMGVIPALGIALLQLKPIE